MKIDIINKLNKNTFILFLFTFLLLLLLLFLFYNCNSNNSLKEGFQWSQDSINKFKILQSTINPLSHFDMQMIQNQASEKEGKELLKTGIWPWSKETQYLYLDAVAREPIVRLTPGFSLQKAKTIYNENAMKQMLSWNTKEGEFLLNGGFANNNNNNNKKRDQIKCFSYVDKPSVLKKVEIDGLQRIGFGLKQDLLNGYKKEKITDIANEDVPNEMPGFSFVGKPCNPCAPLDNDYSCPFRLNVKGDDSISDIWKILWNV